MVDNVRWHNPAQPAAYAACAAGRQEPEPVEILTEPEQMEEFMFLGLRMMGGVSRQKFADLYRRQIEEVYGVVLDRLYRQKLLICEADRIRLTGRGIDVSNYVMAQFLFDR